jgi:hypothetical protein
MAICSVSLFSLGLPLYIRPLDGGTYLVSPIRGSIVLIAFAVIFMCISFYAIPTILPKTVPVRLPVNKLPIAVPAAEEVTASASI